MRNEVFPEGKRRSKGRGERRRRKEGSGMSIAFHNVRGNLKRGGG
jgi:hypothetical protein